jgi:nucleotide-binding universal stress UspA family protein
MPSKILVPLDGSHFSESVLPWLRLLAAKWSPPVQVELVRCFQPVSSIYSLPDLKISPTSYLSTEALEQMMSEYLTTKKAELDGLQVGTATVINDAANGVLDKSETCDWILMASQGAGGLSRWLLGSVTSRVVHGSTKPIAVVTARAVERAAKVERILVAVDGSPAAERALAAAVELARQQHSQILIYRAAGQAEVIHSAIAQINEQQLERAEAYVKGLAATVEGLEGVETLVRGRLGDTAIVDVAQERDVDFIVMGRGNKGSVERWLLGSQTERALRYAHCPVLIVP